MADDWELSTPVALTAYNRPDTTRQVFDRIADVRPPALFVVADGPVAGDPDDHEQCAAVREIVSEVDWTCDVHTRFRDTHRGLPAAVYEGLDWVFGQVPEAIVLPDDAVPNRTFFRFCETMLDRYRDDDRVMSVNGTNRLGTWRDDRQDYHFVTYQGDWGWATWRRAWERYDPDISAWADPETRERIRDVLCDDERYEYHRTRFQSCYEGRTPGWSKRWEFAHYRHNGLAAVPSRNLVSNVGFDERGLYTTDPDHPLAALPRYSLEFPIEERDVVAPDRTYERECYERFKRPTRLQRLRTRLRRGLADVLPARVKRRIPQRFR